VQRPQMPWRCLRKACGHRSGRSILSIYPPGRWAN